MSKKVSVSKKTEFFVTTKSQALSGSNERVVAHGETWENQNSFRLRDGGGRMEMSFHWSEWDELVSAVAEMREISLGDALK